MPSKRKTPDKYVQQIAETLQREYLPSHPKARIDVYRYNSASIRIRIVDADFSGQGLTERDDAIWDILDQLPEDVRAEISLLLLLTPKETKTSLMNQEFDDPTPSRL